MNLTKHQKVLSVLEKRALRYRDRGGRYAQVSTPDSIDETGTVSTEGLTDDSDVDSIHITQSTDDDDILLEQREREEVAGVSDELLRVHGVAPGSKGEGVTRLMYENSHSINNRITGNVKLDKAKELIDDLEADLVAYNEHRLNMMHKENRNGFSQMFKGGEADIRSVSAHNVHEGRQVGRTQEGGTAMLLYGSLIEQYNHEESGRDPSGLGRWVVMTLQGSNGIRTRIVCGYNPCYNNKPNSRTVYQQHRRHFILREKDDTCPRKRFRQDLVAQLEKWREEGDRLIVCMDANENIYKKSIGKTLTKINGLGMREVVGDFTGQQIGATFFRGSTPIDAVWATPDVEIVGACVMPCGFGIGDHRLFVIDIRTESLVGQKPPRVIRASARRLNTKIPRGKDRYVDKLERELRAHRIPQRILAAAASSPHAAVVKERTDAIDEEKAQYMRASEKRCRKIKSGRIPFSDKSAVWIRRRQVYHSLLRYHRGEIRNRANLKRAARRCGINRALQLTVKSIKRRLKECEKQCNYFQRHGHRYRRKFLERRLSVARIKNNDKAVKEILAIIDREKQRAFWRRMNYTMKTQKGKSARIVQVQDDEGGIVEHATQEAVENAIWSEIHGKRFYLAEQAPVCQGRLRGQFGYMADTAAAEEVLAGVYEPEEDVHTGTVDLFDEIGRIRAQVQKDSVNCLVRHPLWQKKWKQKREETSSSESGLHFGHYIAGADSELISYCHALLAWMALQKGYSPSRWERALSCMLEKIAGCSLVEKMRAILLMEADFNFMNKMIVGDRLLNNARQHGFMAEEIFSEQGRTAEDGSLAKVLFYDIIRQFRIPGAIASIDAANCYDSIAHAIASMIFQAFGLPVNAVKSMLGAIQEMKYFLRTAYGDSKNFANSTIEVKYQGLCQGNGLAPAGWALISITMLNAHKRRGHTATFRCPVSKVVKNLCAILFVDDCDLLHIAMTKLEHVSTTHERMQESILNWGQLLIASGGSYKPPKCFYHLLSFGWKPNGTWYYEPNHELEEFDVVVPMPDGSVADIEHLPADTTKKTLGVWTCPTGKADGALDAMKEKCLAWVDKAKTGGIHRRDVWFLADKQMWPSVGYGIGSNLGTIKQLDHCLKNPYWKLVPLGGVIRTTPAPIRQLDRGFYGVGLPQPSIECMIAQIQCLLMHYGCKSALGHQLTVSINAMIIELGLSDQPFQESYSRYGSRVTDCWAKRLWEKIDEYGVKVVLKECPLSPPRKRDRWFMRALEDAGVPLKECNTLNPVRLSQQVLYLSDVLGPTGKSLDSRYLHKRPEYDTWSNIEFPQERPPQSAYNLWARALRRLVPAAGIVDRLGNFYHDDYKVWEWRYDAASVRLLHVYGDLMDVYTASENGRHWNLVAEEAPLEKIGRPCSVRAGAAGSYRLVSVAEPLIPKPSPTTIREVLDEWDDGETDWMWRSLRLTGTDEWLVEAIRTGSLVAVTDGSYIREMHPELCSAAFILECRITGGRMVGSFPELSPSSSAFRGEMLGLLAIHLILLAINKLHPELDGQVAVYSDCLGALRNVSEVPSTRLPARTKHADILKIIMVHCQDFPFNIIYRHIRAHQDDRMRYSDLIREAQLNCQVDYLAKNVLWGLEGQVVPPQEMLPLEAVGVFAGRAKITSGPGETLRFWSSRIVARRVFQKYKILQPEAFDAVAWRVVHSALWEIPRMFQIWAAKQVMELAGTNEMQSRYKENHDRRCPSCNSAVETCGHVLMCREEGRVDVLQRSIDLLDDWLIEQETDEELRFCLIDYARGRGGVTMYDLCHNKCARYQRFARSQDLIGWRRFMEGMISKELLKVYNSTSFGSEEDIPAPSAWAKGLVIKLLETTHGQWLYRNMHVHDAISGALATAKKEELQKAIEDELELGGDGLAEEDLYLLEINLDDLATTSGEDQTYWLLAIRAARAWRLLQRQRQSESQE